MDPNLFAVDGERLMEVLFMIVVLSFFVERALSIFFESRFFVQKLKGKNLKEILAFAASAVICVYWNFDAISILIVQDQTTLYGELITGAVIAGGSKGSVKLFHDLLGVKSSAAGAASAAAKLAMPPVKGDSKKSESVTN
jgi:hypothetical protein